MISDIELYVITRVFSTHIVSAWMFNSPDLCEKFIFRHLFSTNSIVISNILDQFGVVFALSSMLRIQPFYDTFTSNIRLWFNQPFFCYFLEYIFIQHSETGIFFKQSLEAIFWSNLWKQNSSVPFTSPSVYILWFVQTFSLY